MLEQHTAPPGLLDPPQLLGVGVGVFVAVGVGAEHDELGLHDPAVTSPHPHEQTVNPLQA